MTSEFAKWRIASGYTYDMRQEQAWQAATRAERERCIGQLNKLADGYFNAQYLDSRNQDRGFIVLRCVNTIRERETPAE